VKRTSLLIVDDHPLVLIGLRDFLSAQRDMRVIGTESDPSRAAEVVLRLKPDVMIVDLMMPGLSGMALIRQVHQRSPDMRIVVLSMHSDAAYVSEALHGGAMGYVLKCTEPEALLRAIRAVMSGARYLSPPLSENEVKRHLQRGRQPGIEAHELLTRREREVLRLVVEGKTSAAIAALLGIGVRTVESHRANLLSKLDLHNQTELVRYAVQHGLVSLG